MFAALEPDNVPDTWFCPRDACQEKAAALVSNTNKMGGMEEEEEEEEDGFEAFIVEEAEEPVPPPGLVMADRFEYACDKHGALWLSSQKQLWDEQRTQRLGQHNSSIEYGEPAAAGLQDGGVDLRACYKHMPAPEQDQGRRVDHIEAICPELD